MKLLGLMIGSMDTPLMEIVKPLQDILKLIEM
jgi:hypothetical protein